MPLRKIIKKNYDERCQQLRRRGEPAKIFDENFQADVVEQHTGHDDKKIPEELYPAPEIASVKGNIHAQIKADWKGYDERNEKSCYMRLKSDKTQMKDLVLQNVMVRDKINEKGQKSIGAATRGIMIGLQGHEPPEQGIKYIQECEYS